MQNLYHIATRMCAEQGRTTGMYAPGSLKTEGFVHCSYANQLAGVLTRYFDGVEDLVVLEIDPAGINSPIKVENLLGGDELFPHIYGQIPWACVLDVRDIERG